MKLLRHFYLCSLIWLCLPLHARDLTTYHLGDLAEADIITPVALDVVDPAATATLQSAHAREFPAIFRSQLDITNAITSNFLTTFDQARTHFLAEMASEFQAQTLNQSTIASADFGRLVTAFGVENKNFPVPDALAAEWARGSDGSVILNQMLGTLLQAARQPIYDETLPKDFFIGQAIRLVPVSGPDQKLAYETVQNAPLTPAANLKTLANAQALLRREFPAEQQLFARALASLLKPNCRPDVPFTQLTRGTAVCQLVVSDHYDAGDAIVRAGTKIDEKIKAALTALNEKLVTQTAAAPAIAEIAPPATPAPLEPATPVTVVTPAITAHTTTSLPTQPALKPVAHHLKLIASLAGVSLFSLLVAGWQFLTERKRKKLAEAAAQVPLPFSGIVPSDLTPQVAVAVREAVQQELAMQRRELLMAQQAATDEISELVQRLDELQLPMQQRLQTYENRIQMLEKELALRNEENRELLKVKIELINRQLELERNTNTTYAMAAMAA